MHGSNRSKANKKDRNIVASPSGHEEEEDDAQAPHVGLERVLGPHVRHLPVDMTPRAVRAQHPDNGWSAA
jgi:hypothetical protein